jgi:argininosuccinate lyase
MVRELLRQGRSFESLTLDEWRQFSDRFADDIREAIRPEASVASRRTPQSTAPAAVGDALAATRAWLDTENGAGT